MKYRTKLYIALVCVAFASILLGLVIFSTESEKLVMRVLRSRSESIAATAAVLVNPELMGSIKKGTSITSPEYLAARKELRKVQEANRREDIFVADIYTLYLDPENPRELYFGVEADQSPFLPGTVYADTDKDFILDNLGTSVVDPTFITDQWGVWLSAYSPIRTANGDYVATLGVDINAADIHTRLEELIKFGIYGLAASLILALLIAFFLSKRVTISLDHLCHTVKEIGEGNLQAHADLHTEDEFGELSDTINEMTKGLQERARLKTSFARYVSQHVMEKILHSDTPLKLEGEKRKVTLLFSDIRRFTELSETLQPEAIVQLLNEYFEGMIEVIFTHMGTLDKFIGDGIMAEFGAPLDDGKQEEHAVRAAIAMQKELAALRAKWVSEHKPPFEMGIGIHTGEAVLGNIGSERRIEYTAIGDAVNVASRLEQATKILKKTILVSETTYLGCKDLFPFEDLGSMALPGRREQIRVYTIKMEEL
jgi:adenylate cyclase